VSTTNCVADKKSFVPNAFCFCSIVLVRHLESAKWQPNGNRRLAVDRRLIGGRFGRHF
jgi:hypothetical protein